MQLYRCGSNKYLQCSYGDTFGNLVKYYSNVKKMDLKKLYSHDVIDINLIFFPPSTGSLFLVHLSEKH